MRSFYKYFKDEVPIALLGIFFVAAVAFLELYQIKLMAEIIDVGIANSDFSIILRVGIKMIGLALLGAFLAMLGLVFPSEASNNFALKLRRDVFQKVQTYSLKNLNDFKTASLVTRLTNDVNFLQRTLMMMLRLLVRAPVFLVMTVVLTYLSSPELSLVMLAAVVFLSFILFYIVRQGFPRFIRLQDKVDKMNRKIQESLMNSRLIKSFVRESYESDNFDEDNYNLYEASVNANMLMAIMGPALMTAINFATVFVVYIGSYLIVDYQAIHVGDLLVFINYLRFTMFSMMMITHVLMMISRSKASAIRIKEVLDTDSDIQDLQISLPDEKDKSQGLVFNQVSFQYYQDAPKVLNDISFEVAPGEKVGIIGSTGSGKTSLVNLMARLIDASEGEIKLHGKNIKDYKLRDLRAHFGFVPQNNILFSGTIAENLRLGNKKADDSLLWQALEVADISEYVDAEKDQLSSLVQQGGRNFSGGQRQRLCIARALVVQPEFLVLDDSTSALDAATEERVTKALYERYPNMAIINIAQKISSVINSDKIIVLDQGSIVGVGKHQTLLENCKIYQEIYESQMEKGGLE